MAGPFVLMAIGLFAADARAQSASGPFQPAFYAYNQYLGGERGLALGDVNGDGKPDLAFAGGEGSYCYNTLGVLLGNGDGTFQTPNCFDPGGTAYPVALADMNGDGKLDLIGDVSCDGANNCATGNIAIFPGNGDGTFQSLISNTSGIPGAGVGTLAIGDVNGDGRLDVVAVNGVSNTAQVLLGNGDGTLQSAVSYNPPYAEAGGQNMSGGIITSTVVADVNADGNSDIVLLSACATNSDCSSGAMGFLLGNGDGTFQSSSSSQRLTQNTFFTQAYWSTAMMVADLNGDGVVDVAVASSGPSNGDGVVSVLLGTGATISPIAAFQPAVTYDSGGVVASAISGADMNGDGRPDLVVLSNSCPGCANSSSVGVLLNSGNGKFQPVESNTSGPYGTGPMLVSDLNGDRVPDAVVNANQVFTLLGVRTAAAPLPLWAVAALAAGLMGLGICSVLTLRRERIS